jgi:hypothetical protein
MKMPVEFYREMDDDFLSAEIIRLNHREVEMLAKKGVRIKVPMWDYPMAS